MQLGRFMRRLMRRTERCWSASATMRDAGDVRRFLSKGYAIFRPPRPPLGRSLLILIQIASMPSLRNLLENASTLSAKATVSYE